LDGFFVYVLFNFFFEKIKKFTKILDTIPLWWYIIYIRYKISEINQNATPWEGEGEKRMETAKQLLAGMINDKTYTTTRGTVGDADGITTIDDEIVERYAYCEVVKLLSLKDINEKAYDDIIDFIKKECPGTSENDYYVIIDNCEYMLAW
jgi:hypothetical protein